MHAEPHVALLTLTTKNLGCKKKHPRSSCTGFTKLVKCMCVQYDFAGFFTGLLCIPMILRVRKRGGTLFGVDLSVYDLLLELCTELGDE